MDDLLGDAWQWVQDFSGAVTALAAIATAAFAVWAIFNGGRDSRDRTRPMVIAEFTFARDSDTTVDLVIRNAGVSMARQLSVTFDPRLVLPPGSDRRITNHLIRRYESTLSGLAPGQQLRNIWWAGGMVAGSNDLQNSEPTPDQVTVSVAYSDDRNRAYTDSFSLDVRDLLRETYSVSSTSIKGRLETINASLKTTGKALETIAKAATRVEHRASGASLNGLTVEEYRALRDRLHAQRERDALREHGLVAEGTASADEGSSANSHDVDVSQEEPRE